ncbi:MAG: tetratricopeptide repeat protein [Gemmatimonadaceae bacterium]|nr:tetratricopeptide repeat protein [Gemmatimonadaceae bacterium]
MTQAHRLAEAAREAETRGENARALALYDDALAELGSHSSDPLAATVLRWKGTLLRETGQTEEACRHYLRSLAVAERTGLADVKAHVLNCLAIIAQRRGDLREAERLYEKASECATEGLEHRLLGMIQQNRGVLANMRGDFPAASSLYEESLKTFEIAGDDQAVSWVLNNLGMLHTKLGHLVEAQKHLESGLAIAKRRDDALVEEIITLNLAELWVRADDLELAEKLCSHSLEAANRRSDRLTAAEALTCRARIERKRGEFDKGIASLQMARFEAQGSEDRMLHAEIQRELGQLARDRGDTPAAKDALSQAAVEFRNVGALHDAVETETLLMHLSPG